jgi:hypothetical protein
LLLHTIKMEYPSESFVKHILCTIYPVTCLYIHIHQNCALNVRKHRKGNKINGQSRETGNVGYTRHRTKWFSDVWTLLENIFFYSICEKWIWIEEKILRLPSHYRVLDNKMDIKLKFTNWSGYIVRNTKNKRLCAVCLKRWNSCFI